MAHIRNSVRLPAEFPANGARMHITSPPEAVTVHQGPIQHNARLHVSSEFLLYLLGHFRARPQ